MDHGQKMDAFNKYMSNGQDLGKVFPQETVKETPTPSTAQQPIKEGQKIISDSSTDPNYQQMMKEKGIENDPFA